MSTPASVAPRLNDRESANIAPGPTAPHPERRGLDNGHYFRGQHFDPALAYLHAEWGDIAVAVVKRRAAEQQSALRAESGQQGARRSNERRSREAAS